MEAHLRYVSPDGNHNKSYDMVLVGDHIEVTYGRIGATPMHKTYPASAWERLYREKTNKGYVDMAYAMESPACVRADDEYAPIQDDRTRQLVDALLGYANKAIQSNYSISYDEVTPAMIKEAERILDGIAVEDDIQRANGLLNRLFVVIPRKMKHVEDSLLHDIFEKDDVLERENDLLDAMRAKVSTAQADQPEEQGDTILDAMGISIRPVGKSAEKQILRHLGNNASQYVQGFWVKNKAVEDAYRGYKRSHGFTKSDDHFLIHGTRNMSCWDIILEGLRPDVGHRNGSMFGGACYGAPLAQKAINYTDLSGSVWTNRQKGSRYRDTNVGYIFVIKMAYRDPLNINQWSPMCSSFNKNNIGNHDAVYAHAAPGFLYHDEVMVYRREQCTLQYIVQLKN